MRNVSDKSCTENRNTHFVLSNFFFENRAVYEIMWKYFAEWGWSQMTVWRIRIACWIPKATDTHSVCITLTAFPLQQCLHERASVLRYAYSACLVSGNNVVNDPTFKIVFVCPLLRSAFTCTDSLFPTLHEHLEINPQHGGHIRPSAYLIKISERFR